jgi:RNA polymerase sigma-70 factor (ECF subfamily)
MAAIRAGDEHAFERLFRAHYGELCGYARKLVGDGDTAEEVVQNIFVQLWEKREHIGVTSSPRAYLFSATRNACLNHLDHLKVRHRHAEAVQAQPLDQAADAAAALELQELNARIHTAIEHLPPRCREVFVLSRFEHLKYDEIAQRLAISPRTVEVQIGKALQFLRDHLRELLPLLALLLPWLLDGEGGP